MIPAPDLRDLIRARRRSKIRQVRTISPPRARAGPATWRTRRRERSGTVFSAKLARLEFETEAGEVNRS
jgi:hypothetical protein